MEGKGGKRGGGGEVQTLSPVSPSLPDRALRRVDFPQEGGPSRRVSRPGNSTPLMSSSTLNLRMLGLMMRSACRPHCAQHADKPQPPVTMTLSTIACLHTDPEFQYMVVLGRVATAEGWRKECFSLRTVGPRRVCHLAHAWPAHAHTLDTSCSRNGRKHAYDAGKGVSLTGPCSIADTLTINEQQPSPSERGQWTFQQQSRGLFSTTAHQSDAFPAYDNAFGPDSKSCCPYSNCCYIWGMIYQSRSRLRYRRIRADVSSKDGSVPQVSLQPRSV